MVPEVGESTRPAKAVCARCLVRDECLSFALDEQIREGIWGGTSERERRALRRDGATADAAMKASEGYAERAGRRRAGAAVLPQPVPLDDLDDLDDETLLARMERQLGVARDRSV